MARLVAVCRDGEDDYPFLTRQIPLYIDDMLTMVMEFPECVLDVDHSQINTLQMKRFLQHHTLLQQQQSLNLTVTCRELFSALSQCVVCVGCRRSVERLFSQLMDSEHLALKPLTVDSSGLLSVTRACLADPRKLYALFYNHGSKLNSIIDSIPRSKKNKRCLLHSLDTHKPKTLGGSWMDVWELMSLECRAELVLIDSSSLLETLETYLRKHRFCTDCKNKVMRAYHILVGEVDGANEKGYCAALYEDLRCCPNERHVHICCHTDFIAHLLSRAEPEISGSYKRSERHAKTLDMAQEEVLTCLAVHLYERLQRLWQKLRAEEQTWNMLFYMGIDALRKNFEMSLERVKGVSRLQQLCEQLSEEERARELKQQKKRQKRKNRRKNKCESEVDKNPSLDEDPSVLGNSGCNSCAGGGSSESTISNNETSPSSSSITHSPTISTALCAGSSGSDCGYCSSVEGSETGSGEGSDGTCQHYDTGEDACRVKEDEDEAMDSCVECWVSTEDHTLGKSKKKKRRNKTAQCRTNHGCKTEESSVSDSSTRGCESGSRSAAVHQPSSSSSSACLCSTGLSPLSELFSALSHQPFLQPAQSPDSSSKTLAELLTECEVTADEENALTAEEIQIFVENHKSFYGRREQYRQQLKERFTTYCRSSITSVN